MTEVHVHLHLSPGHVADFTNGSLMIAPVKKEPPEAPVSDSGPIKVEEVNAETSAAVVNSLIPHAINLTTADLLRAEQASMPARAPQRFYVRLKDAIGVLRGRLQVDRHSPGQSCKPASQIVRSKTIKDNGRAL
jgi:hypothetical protein